jgi:hypothetical protein
MGLGVVVEEADAVGEGLAAGGGLFKVLSKGAIDIPAKGMSPNTPTSNTNHFLFILIFDFADATPLILGQDCPN